MGEGKKEEKREGGDKEWKKRERREIKLRG